MSTSQERSKSLSPSAALRQKGGACLNCRRRKIRCDGKRPVCGPCSASSAFRDCEFADAGPTKTQSLEAQITLLQRRIKQLEQASSSGSGSSSASSGPYTDESVTLSAVPQYVDQDHLPATVLEAALQSFVERSVDLGFFLSILRFRESVWQSNPGGDPPSPALLAVAHLWGVHLSSPSLEVTDAQERALQKRAVELTAQGLTDTHPQAVLQCIQANVLLANYFFRNQRILEGRYHANAAMSLVISTRLHMIRSSDPPRVDAVLGLHGELPSPSDPIEEGERINGFWTVFSLNNCWAAADGTPSNLSFSTPGGRIDVPWPREMQEYSQSPFPLGYRTARTVQQFMLKQPDTGTSTLSLYAKASLLLDQASRMGHKFRPDMSDQEMSQFCASFNSLEQVIMGFISRLPALNILSQRTSPSMALLIYSVAHASMIRLHAPFISRNPSSRSRIITSTRIVVQTLQTLDVVNLPYTDSIMGVVWVMVAQVLISEVGANAGGGNNEPMQLLNAIMAVMNRVGSPFIGAQLVLVRRLYAETMTTVSR